MATPQIRLITACLKVLAVRQLMASRIGASSDHQMGACERSSRKSGSAMALKDFAKSIRKAIAKGAIPEYSFTIFRSDSVDENVTFKWRRGLKDDSGHRQAEEDTQIEGDDVAPELAPGNDPPTIDGVWTEITEPEVA